MADTATRPLESVAPAPSLKALGKRPLSTSNSSNPQTLVQQVKQQEKRVTRSSLGGSNGTRDKLDENGSNESGSSSPLYLPVDTAILLTTRLLPGLTHYPPTTSQSSSSSSVPAPTPVVPLPPDPLTTTSSNVGADGKKEKDEKPLFRLMDETEFLPSRGSRHQPLASVDTSDALYHRLHRYPEVLEKRASRLERERLIHERSKLINELEELRGRGWVYTGNSSAMGGRAEVERQRKLKEGEERLARYDALLPNQPRKSNFLNLSSNPVPSTSSLPTSTSLPNLSASSRRTNSASPAPSALSHSASSHNLNTRAQQRSNRPSSLSRPVPIRPGSTSSLLDPNGNGRGKEISRPPTPVSATSTGGNGSMKIRIRFDTTSTNTTQAQNGPPRRGREGERKLPERSGRGGRKSYAEDDDEESDEEDLEMEDAEEEEESSLSDLEDDEPEQEEEEDEKSFDTSITSIPRATSSASITQKPSRPTPQPRPSAPPIPVQTRPSKPPRIRLKNSFFQTPSLRDQLFPKQVILSQFKPSSSTPSAESGLSKQKKENRRRSSSRVAYAFGHRLPDAALLKQAEFEPHGGGQGKSTPLEEMILARMVKRGEGDEVVVLGGRLLPKSAVDAWRIDPVRVKRQRELSGRSQEEDEVVKQEEEQRVVVPSTAAPPRPRSIPPPPVQTKPQSKPSPIPVPVPVIVPSQPKPKPIIPSVSSGGGGLGFAQPSKTQVLFASVPSVKRAVSGGHDEMEIDR